MDILTATECLKYEKVIAKKLRDYLLMKFLQPYVERTIEILDLEDEGYDYHDRV